MIRRLETLGSASLALMALTAIAAVSAVADTGGHFTSEEADAEIVGTESGEHQIHFNREGGTAEERIGCVIDSYSGAISNDTVDVVTIFPDWQTCRTTKPEAAHFEVHENGCSLRFTIGNFTHNTVHLFCLNGKAVEITHPNCQLTVPAQTVTGIAYLNEVSGKVTLKSTVKNITAHRHNGICIFLGTTQVSEVSGSVTVKGVGELGDVTIEATG
jgi:hypothetical protein